MQRLTLFAKRPLAGHVKTRLVPPLSPEQAVELHRAFVADQLRTMARFAPARRIELCSDGPWPDPVDVPCLILSEQGDGDLGARLARHFGDGHRRGIRSTLVLGADAPLLPETTIRDGLERLAAGSRVVVSPAADGGYTAIGMTAPLPELFEGIPWGGPEVWATTRRRAAAAGVELTELTPGFDVDDAASLARLAEALRDPGARARAPATAALLRRLDRANGTVL